MQPPFLVERRCPFYRAVPRACSLALVVKCAKLENLVSMVKGRSWPLSVNLWTRRFHGVGFLLYRMYWLAMTVAERYHLMIVIRFLHHSPPHPPTATTTIATFLSHCFVLFFCDDVHRLLISHSGFELLELCRPNEGARNLRIGPSSRTSLQKTKKRHEQ